MWYVYQENTKFYNMGESDVIIMKGSRIQDARKTAGYTQQSLADELGVSVRTVTFWEAGERTPSLELLVKLADILHVSTDYLLGRDAVIADSLPFPETIAAHTDGPMTPELQAEIEAIARKVMEKYLKDRH